MEVCSKREWPGGQCRKFALKGSGLTNRGANNCGQVYESGVGMGGGNGGHS